MDSLVTVVIPEVDHTTYRTHADVSMLVRTRESDGLIFYLGTREDDITICKNISLDFYSTSFFLLLLLLTVDIILFFIISWGEL